MGDEKSVPKMEAAFPLCTATERCLIRVAVAFGLVSPVVAESLRPSSLRKIMGRGPSTSDVSMAIGVKQMPGCFTKYD